MYVRFAVPQRCWESGCRLGIFQAIYDLRWSGDLQPYAEAHARELLLWFDDNLRAPRSFARARRHNPAAKAVCWFRDGAHDHIARMWDLAAILEEHGRPVEFLKTGRPGYVTYRDQYQVTAEPFADTRT